MICAEFERTKEGWKVDVEWRGYGNAEQRGQLVMKCLQKVEMVQRYLICGIK